MLRSSVRRWGTLGGATRVVAVGLLVAALAAAWAPAAGAQDEEAQVRVVHASPDAPAVDVFVDGARAIEGLAFGSATEFVALPAGEHDVAVVPAGADEDAAVIEATLDLEGGAAYQVVAVGTLDEIGAEVYPVDLSATADGQARVRVVHASPDAPAVDVAVAGGPVLFAGAEFPGATDYAEVDAGSYDLEVRPAGTEDVALDLPGVDLEASTVYDVFAIGLLEDGSLRALPLAAPAAAGGEGDGEAEGEGDEEAAAPATSGTTSTVPATGVGSAFGGEGANPFVLGALLLAALGAAALAVRGSLGLRAR